MEYDRELIEKIMEGIESILRSFIPEKSAYCGVHEKCLECGMRFPIEEMTGDICRFCHEEIKEKTDD